MRLEIITGGKNYQNTPALEVQMGDVAAPSSPHFHVGGPLCDTWAPKSQNAAQSGCKRAQIVLKNAKSCPKVVPKVASRVLKMQTNKQKNV